MKKRVNISVHNRGFTLIELIVTIGIIALLSSIIIGGLGASQKKSRDAQRISDLKKMELALEIYRDVNGSYPLNDSCGTAPWSSPGPNTASWGDSCDDYIPGLVPNILPKLPTDPSSEQVDGQGYLYRSDGSEYKLLTHGTVESEIIDGDHEYARFPNGAGCSGTMTGIQTLTYAIYSDSNVNSGDGAECW